jgi:hypothetical protein
MKICKVEDCKTPTTPDSARGYCTKHYLRLRRYGDVNFVKLDKHGETGSREHNSWMNMHSRCYQRSNNRYIHYGGRGIKVCDRWLGVSGFRNFLEDMGNRPKGMTLDRIDVNGNYTLGNCRWATPSVQQFNIRRNHVTGIEQISQNSWRATITLNYKKIRLGCYKTKQQAIEARLRAESQYLPSIFAGGTS